MLEVDSRGNDAMRNETVYVFRNIEARSCKHLLQRKIKKKYVLHILSVFL